MNKTFVACFVATSPGAFRPKKSRICTRRYEYVCFRIARAPAFYKQILRGCQTGQSKHTPGVTPLTFVARFGDGGRSAILIAFTLSVHIGVKVPDRQACNDSKNSSLTEDAYPLIQFV